MARRWQGSLAMRALLPMLSLPEPVFRDEQVPYEERKATLDLDITAVGSREIAERCPRYALDISRERAFSHIPNYNPSFKGRKDVFPNRKTYFPKSGRR